jgi:hypothetical protein
MFDWRSVSQDLQSVYRGTRGYLDGLVANPRDANQLVGALKALCGGLEILAGPNGFLDELERRVRAVDDPGANLETWLEDEFHLVANALGDKDLATRLFDDLGAALTQPNHNPIDVERVRAATLGMRDLICTAYSAASAALQANNLGWRQRFRLGRIALGGLVFLAGGVLVAVDVTAAINNPGLAGLAGTSVKVGADAMMKAYDDLSRDLHE